MASQCRDLERREKIPDAMEVRFDREMRGLWTLFQIVIAILAVLFAIFLARTGEVYRGSPYRPDTVQISKMRGKNP